MDITPEVQRLIERGTLFVINHSGGKDSQAMTLELMAAIPRQQLLVIHADLPEVDWAGIREHIDATVDGLPVIVCRAVKTFFQMVEHRGMFPSPTVRQCTSDLKRGPIERTIRRYLAIHPEYRGRVVNCMGLRAEESSARAKAVVFKLSSKNSVAGREWYDWLPIHRMTERQVYARIASAGQTPHPAYAAGMTRLSCCFCIMASRKDLTTAARLQPALYARYVAMEKQLGHTFLMPVQGQRLGLEAITGITATKGATE
jgi:3'-phosphoadenosine 5'-phosphosulfate sulfotransferase (PAPS reductase)/FAD synthetase